MTTAQNVYLKRIPAGIAGSISREWEHTGEPVQLDPTNPPALFGDFCKIGTNERAQALAPGDTAAAVYGLLERAYPGAPGTYQSGPGGYSLGAGSPVPGGRGTAMRRGYMTVTLQGTTIAKKNGQVFVRVAGAPPAGGRLNGIEAVADATAGNTVAVPGCTFMGAADTAGNVEIAYNI